MKDRDPKPKTPARKGFHAESALAKMMTVQEYSGIRHRTPYVFELSRGEKHLTYFGASHENRPNHPQFAELQDAFENAKPDIVLVEGMRDLRENKQEFARWAQSMTRDEIIRHVGEPGLSIKLAFDKGIEAHSPEPGDADVYNHLLSQGFTKDEVFSYMVFRMLPQYQSSDEKVDFRDYVKRTINQFAQTTQWENYDYSYEHAMSIGESIVGHSVQPETSLRAEDYVDPIPYPDVTETAFHRVARATSLYRDTFMVREIAEVLRSHNRLFIVFGSSHAIMQEPALRELMKE